MIEILQHSTIVVFDIVMIMQLKPTSKRKHFSRRSDGIRSELKMKVVRVILLMKLLKELVLMTSDKIITIARVTIRAGIRFSDANVIRFTMEIRLRRKHVGARLRKVFE